MGRVFSSLKREVKNFNIENRAQNVISNDKVRPPPKYSSTVKEINELKFERGVDVEEFAKKHEKLDINLKNLYVVSKGDQPAYQSTRQLPLDRISDRSEMEYGYIEPESVPIGKISLKNTLELLSRNNDDPSIWTPAKLASHYQLEVGFVEQLLDRYKVFELHLPDKKDEKARQKTWAAQVKLQFALKNINKVALIKGQTKEKQDSSTTEMAGVKPT